MKEKDFSTAKDKPRHDDDGEEENSLQDVVDAVFVLASVDAPGSRFGVRCVWGVLEGVDIANECHCCGFDRFKLQVRVGRRDRQ